MRKPRPRAASIRLPSIMVGGDHRGAAGDNQIAEQPQLCVEIMRDVGMIIHVVARQVGKAAGRDTYAIEPKLIEAMR